MISKYFFTPPISKSYNYTYFLKQILYHYCIYLYSITILFLKTGPGRRPLTGKHMHVIRDPGGCKNPKRKQIKCYAFGLFFLLRAIWWIRAGPGDGFPGSGRS